MLRATATIAAALIATPAAGQDLAGNPMVGGQLARSWCARCHDVEPASTGPGLLNAPPFQDVADDPAVTRTALRAFLSTSHANMPNLILSPAEADDVIAYIMKMREAPPQAAPRPDNQPNEPE